MLAAVLLLTGCAAPGEEQAAADSPVAALKTTQQRRDEAERYMRHMMSLLWQVDTSLTYSYRVNSGDPTMDDKGYVSTLEPGKIYSGLPYTYGNGDAESFALFGERMDNGVLRMNGLTVELISGSGGMSKANNIARIGNDCADAVFAAWSRVSCSVSFPNAANMTPKYGCIPVGDYETVGDDVSEYGITGDICKEFIDETPLPVEEVTDSFEDQTFDENSMFDGAFISNYRISDVRVDILDGSGEVLSYAVCCAGGGERNLFLLSRFEAEAEQRVLAGGIHWEQLQKGQEYTARFTCRLSTGAEFVPREFTFTY